MAEILNVVAQTVRRWMRSKTSGWMVCSMGGFGQVSARRGNYDKVNYRYGETVYRATIFQTVSYSRCRNHHRLSIRNSTARFTLKVYSPQHG